MPTAFQNDEQSRLIAIDRYARAGALVGKHLGEIVELARSMFEVDRVAFSTIYDDRQICHVRGDGVDEDIARVDSFCQSTIRSDDVLVVPDARSDPRFCDLPMVRGKAHVRFYAGAPLITPDGYRLGALSLFDTRPRTLSKIQVRNLKRLASLAMEHMNLLCAREEARFDMLTGVLNRGALVSITNRAIAEGHHPAAFLIDLDGFKDVNDSLSHTYGDMALVEVARRLRTLEVEGRVIARLGGDEFVLLIGRETDLLEAGELADRIVRLLAEPIVINGHLLHLGGSVGMAIHSVEPDALALLGNADLAMYQAKHSGRNCYRVFENTMRSTALERANVILELQEGWEDGAIELYYQPLVRLDDGAWVGAEALLRWNVPYRGVLAPAVFLPVLERSHLAIPVGSWIIRDACRQVAAWRKVFNPEFRVSVNLFEAQFKTGDLVDIVRSALAEHDIPPSALKLEITENILLAQDRRIVDQLTRLRDLGVDIAFDDFGTGFASLSALKDYPVTCLKIDRSFIANVTESDEDLAIVDALLGIARTFDLSVIAEGVEDARQAKLIRERSCEYAQGYFFSRPAPVEAFEAAWRRLLIQVRHNEPAPFRRAAAG